MIKYLLALAVSLSTTLLAQTHQEIPQSLLGVNMGQVTRSVPLPTGQGSDFTVDFSLIQDIGGVDSAYFSFAPPTVNGPFRLVYTGDWLCNSGCEFDGAFKSWHFQEIKDGKCVIFEGTVAGTFTIYGIPHVIKKGKYFQEVCANDGSFRFAGGDLSIEYGD